MSRRSPRAVLSIVLAGAGWLLAGPRSPLWAEGPPTPSAAVPEKGPLRMDAVPGASFRFGGVMGDRFRANVENWLLVAPDANPGMIEMFRKRDRQPAPNLVPWAGEFIGKYLVSAIPVRRMTDDPRMDRYLRRVLRAFIETQAEDGYLGPFRKEERLRGHWDLWGHYHAMMALLMWYEETGEGEALRCARRAAELISSTFLDTGVRVLDAGSHEMNMAVIHALAWLYRLTGNPRVLRMVREIEKDWESAGDYLRTGLAGRPFYRTPRPRWESLHDLQGLVELYRVTGEDRYRQAFVHHWTSIVAHDRHPSGGFSTGERAVGNPYSPGAIETCCTTAWMALTLDMLRLTGEPLAADELELSTWNSVLGSQHPSGRWWTYNTPMDGVREASAHTIVFQARHGTPELNCCSVNAPRGLGILSRWAVMRDGEGPIVNYYGPCRVRLSLADGSEITVTQETRYPADGRIDIRIGVAEETGFNLRLRIPHWSARTEVRVNGRDFAGGGAPGGAIRPGRYLPIQRRWRDGDEVDIHLDMSLRHWAGELARTGRAALYTGPILLAFDQHFNEIDTNAIPTLDLSRLEVAPAHPPASETPSRPPGSKTPGTFPPTVLLEAKGAGGWKIVLCDFATAGACGTDYVSWLPVACAGPPPFWLLRPRPGERVAAGPMVFEWTGYRSPEMAARTFTLLVSRDPEGEQVVRRVEAVAIPRHLLREGLEPGTTYHWKVTAKNLHGSRESILGPRPFTVDPSLENTVEQELDLYRWGKRDLMVASPLDGNATPTFGVLESENGTRPSRDRFGKEAGAVAFDGERCAIKYRLPYFPERGATFSAWVCPQGLPTDRLHQVFSAWCAGMDDPMRVVFHGGELFARIEAGTGYGTKGVPVENGRWIHVACVKDGPRLSLYVNGELRQSAEVPELVYSSATGFAIGANPHYEGNECLIGAVDDFAFHGQALAPAEIEALYRAGEP